MSSPAAARCCPERQELGKARGDTFVIAGIGGNPTRASRIRRDAPLLPLLLEGEKKNRAAPQNHAHITA